MLLALGVTAPYWRPGYLLVLDSVAGPRAPWPWDVWGIPDSGIAAGLPWQVAQSVAAALAASAGFEKVFYPLAIFLAGWGAARLVRAYGLTAQLFGGALYAVNPFVYDRLWAGQIGVVLGFSILPHFVATLLAALEAPSLRRVPGLALRAGAIGLFEAHLLYLLPPIVLLAWGWRSLSTPRPPGIPGAGRSTMLMLTGLGTATIALELYWLGPALAGSPLAFIDRTQIAAFATLPDPNFGLVFNVASLHGFWREFGPSKQRLPLWWALFLVLALLAAAGFWRLVRDPVRRHLGGLFASIWALGMFLAMGDGFAPTAPLFLFLFDHLPGFAGLREPGKAITLIALAYAYLAAVGASGLIASVRSHSLAGPRARRALQVSLLAFPLVYGYRELAGQWGELHPVDYPESWYHASNFIETFNAGRDATLFLPWHLYQTYDFSNGLALANPAPLFFPGPVIAGDSTSANGLPLPTSNPASAYIDQLLSRRDAISHLGNLLAPLGIRYVLLSHGSDWQTYGFLDHQEDLRLVGSWPDLALYENRVPISHAWTVSESCSVSDIGDLLALSPRLSLTGAFIPAAAGAENAQAGAEGCGSGRSAQPVSVQAHGGGYAMGAAGGSYLSWSAPFDARWRYAGQQPLRSIEGTNVWQAVAEPAAVQLTGSTGRYVAYSASLATLLALALFELRRQAIGVFRAGRAGLFTAGRHKQASLAWLMAALASGVAAVTSGSLGRGFWAFCLVASLAGRIPARRPFQLALVTFVAVIPLTLAGQGLLTSRPAGATVINGWAEQCAVMAFGFLAMGVLADFSRRGN